MTNTTSSSARKRGRPRRESNPANHGYSVVSELRNDLQNMIGACKTCGKPVHSVAGLAKQIGISSITLSNFLKDKRGLSQPILDKVYAYVWAQKNAPAVTDTPVEA